MNKQEFIEWKVARYINLIEEHKGTYTIDTQELSGDTDYALMFYELNLEYDEYNNKITDELKRLGYNLSIQNGDIVVTDEKSTASMELAMHSRVVTNVCIILIGFLLACFVLALGDTTIEYTKIAKKTVDMQLSGEVLRITDFRDFGIEFMNKNDKLTQELYTLESKAKLLNMYILLIVLLPLVIIKFTYSNFNRCLKKSNRNKSTILAIHTGIASLLGIGSFTLTMTVIIPYTEASIKYSKIERQIKYNENEYNRMVNSLGVKEIGMNVNGEEGIYLIINDDLLNKYESIPKEVEMGNNTYSLCDTVVLDKDNKSKIAYIRMD